MHKVKLTSRGLYKNSKGKTIFRYVVTGTSDAMLAYEQAQGEHYIITDDDVMYYTPNYAGKVATLNISEQGKLFVDNSELNYQADIIKQLGGDLGQSFAQQIAKNMLSHSDKESKKRTDKVKDNKNLNSQQSIDDGTKLDD